MLPSLGLEGLKLEGHTEMYGRVWAMITVTLPTQGMPEVLSDKPSWLIFPRRKSLTPSNPHPRPGG